MYGICIVYVCDFLKEVNWTFLIKYLFFIVPSAAK